MAQNMQIERTDSSDARTRIESAANRFQAWYNREHNELTKKDLRLQIEIAREPDKKKRDAMALQLKASGEKLLALNEGMRRSTILPDQNKTERTQADVAIQSEQRIATIPGRMTNMVRPSNSDDDSPKKLTGLAAVFDSPTIIYGYLGCFQERIAKGAFSDVLARPDLNCKMNFNHQDNYIMSSTASRTLRLYQTEKGLLFWSDLIKNDPLCLAILQRVQSKILAGCSFSFIVAEDGDNWKLPAKQGDYTECTITRIAELFDVTVCVHPAYKQTTIEAVDRADVFFEDPAEMAKYEIYEQELYALDEEIEYQRKQKVKAGYKMAVRIQNRLAAKGVTVKA